jgi:hypothetical protein
MKAAPTEDRTAEAGEIDPALALRAQRLAAIPEADFEAALAEWRQRVRAEHRRLHVRLMAAGRRHGRAP